LSFYCDSFPIEIAYSNAYLLLLQPNERTPEEMKSAFAYLQKMPQKIRNANLNLLPEELRLSFCSLPNHFDSACAFLQSYDTQSQISFLKKLPADIQGKYLSRPDNVNFNQPFFDTISDTEYSNLKPHLCGKSIELYQSQKAEKDKIQALDNALSAANKSLQTLLNKWKAGKGVAEFRNHPLYSFPFYLAGEIQTHPKMVDRANKALWQRCIQLRQSCQQFLQSHESDEELMERTRKEATAIVSTALKTNTHFFKELIAKSSMSAAQIEDWIDRKKQEPNYSYPFQTQPTLLNFMKRTANPTKLVEAVTACSTLLKKLDLEKYTSEKPEPNHAGVKALMEALDRLENISKLQQLIEIQKV
jgi:hypothetical protein